MSAPLASTMTWPLRSTTGASAVVAADPYGLRISLRPWSLNWSTIWAEVAATLWSSWVTRLTWCDWPPKLMPPFEFRVLTQNL